MEGLNLTHNHFSHKVVEPIMFSENVDHAFSEMFENTIEGIKTVAETPSGDHAIHQVVENSLEAVHEALDTDDDGSILDTIPDLVETGLDVLFSFF